MDVAVRYASGRRDLAWCAAHDGWLSEAQLQQKLDAQELVVAESDAELVGLLRLDHLWSTLPHIAQIRVVDQRQRQGVGRALLAFVEREARSRGAGAVLSSTTPDKTAAQEWHRKMGFSECGRLSGFGPNGEPVIVFRKPLEG